MATPHNEETVILSVDTQRAATRILVVCVVVEIALFLLDYHVNYGRAGDAGDLLILVSLREKSSERFERKTGSSIRR